MRMVDVARKRERSDQLGGSFVRDLIIYALTHRNSLPSEQGLFSKGFNFLVPKVGIMTSWLKMPSVVWTPGGSLVYRRVGEAPTSSCTQSKVRISVGARLRMMCSKSWFK